MHSKLRTMTAIEMTDSRKDTKKMKELSQKQILSNLSIAKMNLILCCFVSTTTSDTTNPIKNAIPIRSEFVWWVAAYVC